MPNRLRSLKRRPTREGLRYCWFSPSLVRLLLLALWLGVGQVGLGAVRAETLGLDPRLNVEASAADFPDANAVLLLDDIRFDVSPQRASVFDEHDAIRVLSPEGVQENATLDRIVDSETTQIEVVAARTIKADGKIIDAPKPTLAALVSSSKAYSSVKRFTLRFADVQVGDTVEFHLRTLHKPRAGGHFWATTYVENPMPVLDSTFTVTIPQGVYFRTATPGLSDAQPKEESLTRDGVDYTRRRWHEKNPKAFSPKALTPPTTSLLSRIEVSSFRDWQEVAQYVGDAWQAHSTISDSLAMRVAGWLPNSTDGGLRAKVLLRELAKKRKMVSFFSEAADFHRPSQIYPEAVISLSDSALLTSTILTWAGVPNIPIISLGRSEASLAHELPNPEKVDRIVLKLPGSDGQVSWVDPESLVAALDGPPTRTSGVAAISWDPRFVAGAPGLKTLEETPVLANREELAVEARIERSGRAELAMEYDRYGESAQGIREIALGLHEQPRGMRERMLENFFSGFAGIFGDRARLLSHYVEEDPEAKEPLSLAFTAAVPGYARLEDGMLKVPLPPFLDSDIRSAVIEKKRTAPLVFERPYQQDVRIHMLFPEGSEISALPQRIEVHSDWVDFEAMGRVHKHELWYVGRLTIKKAWIEGDQVARVLSVLKAAVASEHRIVEAKLPPPEQVPSLDGPAPSGEDEDE